MGTIEHLFVTQLYRDSIIASQSDAFLEELDLSCRTIAEDDIAGQRWCVKNGYPGYTSYASLNDLPWRFPVFKQLQKRLDKHVAEFAKALELDLGKKKLNLDSLWINILPEGGVHTSHIHPHSVISGTIYVAMPTGASAIKFEDPRLAMMMAAPPRKAKAARENRSFIYHAPQPGEVLLWESYLRHEVPMNMAEDERISVSFNYQWG
ncbi:MAG: TIGR02466 family protein [Beijerinckiaceae bacterium]